MRILIDKSAAIFGAVAALLLAGTALAHHSYAMYDRDKHVTVEGTIAKFEWTNPHTFLWFYAPKAGGGYQLTGLEGGGPAELTRMGWSKASFKVGEKVTVEYTPLKDGRPGGSFLKATHADGSVTKGEGGPPGAARGAAPAGVTP